VQHAKVTEISQHFFQSYSAFLTIFIQIIIMILLSICFSKLAVSLLPHQSDQSEREGEATLILVTNSLLEELLFLLSLVPVLWHGDLMPRCIWFPHRHTLHKILT